MYVQLKCKLTPYNICISNPIMKWKFMYIAITNQMRQFFIQPKMFVKMEMPQQDTHTCPTYYHRGHSISLILVLDRSSHVLIQVESQWMHEWHVTSSLGSTYIFLTSTMHNVLLLLMLAEWEVCSYVMISSHRGKTYEKRKNHPLKVEARIILR